VGRSCGQDEAAAVHALKSVFERRSVAFVENVASDFDHVPGCDAHDQRIEARWWIAHIAMPFDTTGSPTCLVDGTEQDIRLPR
jgi:hypothetical protein